MKVLIFEDEIPAQEKLILFLKKFDSSIEVADKARSLKKASEMVKRNDIDLIFADIELLDGKIFTIFNEHEMNWPIIFTTSYSEYFQEAFQTLGIGYLLKPYTYCEFEQTLKKYYKITGNSSVEIEKLVGKLEKLLDIDSFPKRITVQYQSEIMVLEVDDITYFEIKNGVIYAAISDQSKYILKERTLEEIYSILNPNDFFRVNRSVIISAKNIFSVSRYGAKKKQIKLKGIDREFLISTRRTPDFNTWLEQNL